MDGASLAGDPTVTRFFFLKYATSYATTSAMVIVIHDFVMSFSQEVDLVWRSPWSLPKIVYLANRYTSLIIGFAYIFTLFYPDYSPARCSILGNLCTWYAWISTVLVQFVLQMWLYAIYYRSRPWLYWVSVLYVLLAGVACGTLMPYLSGVRYIIINPVCIDVSGAFASTSSVVADVQSLSAHKMPSYILGVCAAWGGYTTVLLALLSARVCLLFRARPSRGAGIAFVLFRDSTLYCLTLIALVLFNVLMIVFTPYAIYTVGFGFGVALPSVLSAHILLNLRAVERRRAARVDVRGLAVEQWETMFHIT